jgi:hypothetical protein
MKGTIYGNRLPRGTQVKKGWEPLPSTKRIRGPVGPSTSTDSSGNKYFASVGTRTTTPPYRTYCDIPAPGHELPDLKPAINLCAFECISNHGLPFEFLLSSATEPSSIFILPVKCQLNDITLVYKL